VSICESHAPAFVCHKNQDVRSGRERVNGGSSRGSLLLGEHGARPLADAMNIAVDQTSRIGAGNKTDCKTVS